MQYFICSDIHLGVAFSRYQELEKIIVKSKPKKIIIVGDIFDNTLISNKRNWDFLKDYDVVLIKGNHDQDIKELYHFEIVDEYEFTYIDKKIIAFHGHQFDDYLKKNPFLTIVGTHFQTIISHVDLKGKCIKFLQNMYENATRISHHIKKRSIHYAKQMECDVIICGHAHLAEYFKEDNLEYFNSGDILTFPSHYIICEHDKIELKFF